MSLEMNRYQARAKRTAVFKQDGTELFYLTLKLNGEAGEAAEKVGKVLRDKDGVFTTDDKLDIVRELGDVLWYIAMLSDQLGYSLDTVASLNLLKLRDRQEKNKLHGSGDNR